MLLTSQLVSAQLKTVTWEPYKLQFEIPTDFEIADNSTESFSAGNTDINITIFPQKVSNNKDNMLGGLIKWADAQSLIYDSDAPYADDLDDYWACFIDGTAPNGNETSIMVLVDPKSPETGLYVWLQYNENKVSVAMDMMVSFTKAK